MGAKTPHRKLPSIYCSWGGRRCDRWRSYTSAGDGTGLLEAAVRDAAFETAIEGGMEINECAHDTGRPAVGAEVGTRKKGLRQRKGWTWG